MVRVGVIAVVVPPVAATIVVLLFALATLIGQAPLSPTSQNIAEAAATADAADSVRRLIRGEDPARIDRIRDGLISSNVRYVSAVEAAVFSRKLELVQLFDARGAVRDAETRARLFCIATDIGAADIAGYLRGTTDPACEKGAASRLIEGRTSPAVTR